MHGFQLCANLPSSSLKMTAPRYQDISAADIPEVVDDDGARVRIVVGEFWGKKKGPVDGVAADPRYLDVSVPPGRRKRLAADRTNLGSGLIAGIRSVAHAVVRAAAEIRPPSTVRVTGAWRDPW